MRSGVEQHQNQNVATPLGEDLLGLIRKQITGGTFGEGFGPLQRESGTAIRQFVNSRQDMSPERFRETAQPIMDLHRRSTNRGAADLREGFGIQGARFGTSAARGEGQFRGEAQANLDSTLSQLFEQMRQFDTESLLRGISTMHGMGRQNIEPAFNLAALGILPPDQIVRPSLFSEILGPIAGLAEGAGAAATGLGPQGAGVIGG